jgi:quercetin dioxygenase-like cupin family protein
VQQATVAAVLFLVGSAAGIPLGFALSQGVPQMRVAMLLQRVVTEIPQPTNLRVHDDRWDPGSETSMHDHPGPAILAVVEGELVEETPDGQSTLRAGHVYWRTARQIHNVKNVSGKPARVLAIHFDPAQ